MAAVKPIPDGYHSITPYVVVDNAAEALSYYKCAFGAVELFRIDGPGGKVGHAEFKIGNSIVMIADEYPEMGAKSPKTIGGSPMTLMLYVEDVDRVFNQAVEAGGKIERAVENKFYGDRAGSVLDPFGHTWHIATHQEDISPEECKRRAAELFPSK